MKSKEFPFIVINGRAQSGKDTLGKILLDTFTVYQKDSFAYDLKFIAATYFGWKGAWDEDKPPRERTMLQNLGTEVGRNYYEDMWVAKLAEKNNLKHSLITPWHEAGISFDVMRDKINYFHKTFHLFPEPFKTMSICLIELGWDGKLDSCGEKLITNLRNLATWYNEDHWYHSQFSYADALTRINEKEEELLKAKELNSGIIVTDCRFPNEYEFSMNDVEGSLLIQVNRPDAPKLNHASEGQLEGYYFDIIIQNDKDYGTYQDKMKQCSKIIETLTREDVQKLRANKNPIIL